MRIDEGSYFDKPVGNNKTFRNLMERFMNEHAPKVGINTRKGYATYLKHLSSFFGDTNLMSISPKAISRYKVLRMDKGLRPATINRELSMLSTAFNLAINEWEWIKDNPVSRVTKEKENNQRDKWLTMDEERRLLENAPEWLSEIIIFALNTGLRQDELLSLEWCRVNHLRKTILIQKTKNGSPKTVPLNKTALAILEGRSVVKSVKNDLVFFNSNGKKVINFNLIRAFKRTAKNAGLDDFRFHDLRHTFATRLAQAGVDLYKISKLLGHKDIKMTQRYSHHCPDSLRDGVEILDTDYNLTTIEKKAVC